MAQTIFDQMAAQGGQQQNTPGVQLNNTSTSPAPSSPGGGTIFDQMASQPPPQAPQMQGTDNGNGTYTNAQGETIIGKPGESGIHFNDNDGILSTVGKGVAAVGEGLEHGALDTIGGAADLVGIPHEGIDRARQALDENATDNPILNTVGYGGETLAEFLLGDEALKGLTFAKKMETVAKTASVLEKSPRLIDALKLGAKEAARIGARQGTVQAVQTGLRTDGSLADRAKAGLTTGVETGAIGGVLGGVGNLLEDSLTNIAKTAGKVPNLEKTASSATATPDVMAALSKRIGETEDALHQTYDNGINNLKGRLGGASVAADDNPMQAKAKELLAKPIPDDHPAVQQAVESANSGLDSSTKKLLEAIANGNDPAAEAERAEELAKRAKMGPKPFITPLETEPEPIPARDYNIDDLIKMRQKIRTNIEKYATEPGNTNARTLRSLLWDAKANNGAGGSAIDDTIEALAKQKGDPDAVKAYQDLRTNYRNHINDYDDPLIMKIRDGKLDSAAKQYVGLKRTGGELAPATKVVYNTGVLQNILGDEGLHAFGKEVFHTMLADATTDGNVDYGKFIKTWNRVNEQTKGPQGIFNTGDASNGIAQLAKDAQGAAQLQRLAKLGLGVGGGLAVGATGTAIPHALSAILGLSIADGGLQTGREMLNSMVQSPHLWQAALRAGRLAPVGPAAATAATGVAGQVLNNVNQPDPNLQRRVYQDGASGLQ